MKKNREVSVFPRSIFNSSSLNALLIGNCSNSTKKRSHRIAKNCHVNGWPLVVLVLASCCLGFSGCGFYTVNQAGAANLLSVPASVSFGSVLVGEKATVKVSLVNKGTSPIKLSQLAVTGKSFSLSGSGALPITLAGGGTYELSVQFDPTVSGAATGKLSVTSKTLTSFTSVIELSGTGNGSSPTLSINATSVSFGDVIVHNTSTQSLTLTSTGASPVTISAASLCGTGFTMSALTFPMTLDPGQSTTLSLQFDPTVAGAAAGELTIVSNSSTKSRAEIGLSGIGALHAVQLTWNAPSSSPDAIAGYHIYRSPAGSSSYERLDSEVDAETSYIDGNVESGLTYDYYVTDIDSSGTESPPSNMTSVMVP